MIRRLIIQSRRGKEDRHMSPQSPLFEQVKDLGIPAQDIRNIIGVDAGSFQQWLAREIVPFTPVKTGKRTLRRFSALDLPRIVLVATIWKSGILISDATKVAELILTDIKAAPENTPDFILYFWSSGTVRYMNRGENFNDILSQTAAASCLVISMAEWDKEVENAMRTVLRAREARGDS
jgi:hypothetical protein